jgi:hypothetical protein
MSNAAKEVCHFLSVWHWLESRATNSDFREDAAEALCQCCVRHALAEGLGRVLLEISARRSAF